MAVAAGWIAYTHFWKDPARSRSRIAISRGARAPGAAGQTERRFRRRDTLATYVQSVRPGEPLRLPPIDFSHDEAVFVAVGPRSSTGYALRVVSAEAEHGRVGITLASRHPDSTIRSRHTSRTRIV